MPAARRMKAQKIPILSKQYALFSKAVGDLLFVGRLHEPRFRRRRDHQCRGASSPLQSPDGNSHRGETESSAASVLACWSFWRSNEGGASAFICAINSSPSRIT